MTVLTVMRGSKAKGAGIAVGVNDKIRRLSPTQRNKVVGPRQREQSAHNGHCQSTCYHRCCCSIVKATCRQGQIGL
jgi:hypothetical protein